ncbi:MAG: hypothetical protein H6650_02420 [Ardenticatenales bacterium]|nr:hypothetical protein [Ardenticatenales bacterium]
MLDVGECVALAGVLETIGAQFCAQLCAKIEMARQQGGREQFRGNGVARQQERGVHGSEGGQCEFSLCQHINSAQGERRGGGCNR